MSYLRDLSFLIVESDTKARNRLREALQNCVYKAEIDQTDSLGGGLNKISESKYDAAFVYSDEGIERILNFINKVREHSSSSFIPIIIKLSTGNQDSAFIAELLLGGALGFICEPFSTSQLEKLLSTLSQLNSANLNTSTDDKTIHLQAASLLIAGAMQHLDDLAVQKAKNPDAGGYALRDLKKVSDMLKDITGEIDDTTFNQMLVEKFIVVPPPKRNVVKKVRKSKEKIVHPGEIIQEIISSRKLSIEKVCSIGGIEENVLKNICAKEASVTKEIAESLARAIGKSGKEWLALQTKYDKAISQK